jgi:lipoyl(octanoyl) transferase
MEGMLCEVHWLGRMAYQQAWELQNQMAEEIAQGERPPTLLLLEHAPIFTFGRRGNAANLLWDEAELARREISTAWVDRGGDVTYHGPGQLVGYPLLPLNPGQPLAQAEPGRLPQADYVGYLRRLETMLIHTLAVFGVQGQTQSGLTGVWVEQPGRPGLAKIAAIGVKVDAKGVSRHGFALNVNPNMEHWQGIIACGLEGYQVTSLAEGLGNCPSMHSVRLQLIQSFAYVFGYQMHSVERETPK